MKMIVMFRRRPDLTPDQFRHHYESCHAPLALRLFPYIRGYRRNYIRRHQQHRRAGDDAPLAEAPDFDVITEVLFDSEADYRRMVTDMADPVIRDQVVADEERFLDRAATRVFLVDEVDSRGA